MTTPPWTPTDDEGPPRQTLDATDVAARLEVRVDSASDEGVPALCAMALDVGAAALLCSPAQLARVADEVAGREIQIVTMVGYDRRPTAGHPVRTLAAEAAAAGEAGATEIAVPIGPHVGLEEAQSWVAAVAGVARSTGMRLRALVDTQGLDHDELTRWCRALTPYRVQVVQGGAVDGERADLGQVRTMRMALHPATVLKWTHPVRSLNMMLLCIAEGVDRFNGDAPAIVDEARRRCRVAPLELPVPGHDY